MWYYKLRAGVFQDGVGYAFGDADIIEIEITPNDAILDSKKPENDLYERENGYIIF